MPQVSVSVLIGTLLFGALVGAIIAARVSYLKDRREFFAIERLLSEEQFKEASQAEIDALLSDPRLSKFESAMTQELAEVRRVHGQPIRVGHLWWIQAKARGRVPSGHAIPACVPGDGLESFF